MADLAQRLAEHRARMENVRWEGTFLDYYEVVRQNPRVADLAHARIARMILSRGVGEEQGVHHYPFFEDSIYGIEGPIERLVEYFSSSGRRLDVRKRILLLMGPVGGGKSSLAILLKKGLEVFSVTDEGAAYAIKGCPMHEEPLHLIPETLRPEVEQELGVHIEGELCPSCALRLETEFRGRIEDVPVERMVISEKQRRGIGTFAPSDPKSQDISELTGSIDLSTIGEYGSESDPRAYRFDGELNVANRGILEMVEMLKCDEKFLYNLLTLAQEQNIKTSRFALIYADEVVVAHTNENEYNTFVANKKNEALHNRIIVIKVPYNLRVSQEVRIYEKLLKESSTSDVHVAPFTLKVASMFAILTRLKESKKTDLLAKMKLYDGGSVKDFTPADVRELQEEFPDEGMDGISPRQVINSISAAIVKKHGTCINPIDVLRALRDGLDVHIGHIEKDKLLNFIYEVRKEYDEQAKTEVNRAFVYAFEDSARTIFNNYLDNAEAFCNKTKTKDPLSGEDVPPDEKLMRSIEEQIGVSESAKKAFREEILIKISAAARRGETFDFTSHARLKEAIEKKLFHDVQSLVKITTSTRTPDADQIKKIDAVVERLVNEHGYCTDCSRELLRYVGQLLNR